MVFKDDNFARALLAKDFAGHYSSLDGRRAEAYRSSVNGHKNLVKGNNRVCGSFQLFYLDCFAGANAILLASGLNNSENAIFV